MKQKTKKLSPPISNCLFAWGQACIACHPSFTTDCARCMTIIFGVVISLPAPITGAAAVTAIVTTVLAWWLRWGTQSFYVFLKHVSSFYIPRSRPLAIIPRRRAPTFNTSRRGFDIVIFFELRINSIHPIRNGCSEIRNVVFTYGIRVRANIDVNSVQMLEQRICDMVVTVPCQLDSASAKPTIFPVEGSILVISARHAF